uniref:Adenine DNA glycosylase n=1 Tax=Ananas comosus var. bracteatus TaxID=296719 RepID=A0A6V7NN33_ANACO|nr:unnamed protein product [Ananas comosus var. bracteatus]
MEAMAENPKRRRRRRRAAAAATATAAAAPGEPGAGADVAATAVEDMEDFAKGEAESLRASLLRWYDEHRRSLPWRAASGGDEAERAYAVWVSEVMLQQTRVAVVVDYYNRWMERWPTLRRLASASQEEVNEMWAGLGYYRRARFLLEGAKCIVDKGEFPQTASALRRVPGIGDYTAGAIASIAFNEAAPVVDGNVVRVISRLKAISANPKETATVKRFWKLAGQLVDPLRPGDFNQAIMELGATLCSRTSPGCSSCPISKQCKALSLSKDTKSVEVTDFPAKVLKAKQRRDFAAVCVVQIMQGADENHDFLLVKRPEEGLLAGLWEFPSVPLDEDKVDVGLRRKEMDKYLKKSFNLDIRRNCKVVSREDVGEYVHIFSHIRLRMYVELMILTIKGNLDKLAKSEEQCKLTWKFFDVSSIETMGLTSGVRKVYNMIKGIKDKKLSHPTRGTRKRIKRL